MTSLLFHNFKVSQDTQELRLWDTIFTFVRMYKNCHMTLISELAN